MIVYDSATTDRRRSDRSKSVSVSLILSYNVRTKPQLVEARTLLPQQKPHDTPIAQSFMRLYCCQFELLTFYKLVTAKSRTSRFAVRSHRTLLTRNLGRDLHLARGITTEIIIMNTWRLVADYFSVATRKRKAQAGITYI